MQRPTKITRSRVLQDYKGGVICYNKKGVYFDRVYTNSGGIRKSGLLRVSLPLLTEKDNITVLIGDASDKAEIKSISQKLKSVKSSILEDLISRSAAISFSPVKTNTYYYNISNAGVVTILEVGRELSTIVKCKVMYNNTKGWYCEEGNRFDVTGKVRSLNKKEVAVGRINYIKFNHTPKKKTTRLIEIEGLDGSGKLTQSELLKERLKGLGYSSTVVSFPRYTHPLAIGVEKYLSGVYGEGIDGDQAAAFYAVDRLDWCLIDLPDLKKNYDFIILDRYTGSNLIHQTANKLKGRKEITDGEIKNIAKDFHNREHRILSIAEPDITLYLNLPVEETERAMIDRKHKGNLVKDIIEEDKELTRLSHTVANSIAGTFGWEKIECLQKNGERINPKRLSDNILKILDYRGIVKL